MSDAPYIAAATTGNTTMSDDIIMASSSENNNNNSSSNNNHNSSRKNEHDDVVTSIQLCDDPTCSSSSIVVTTLLVSEHKRVTNLHDGNDNGDDGGEGTSGGDAAHALVYGDEVDLGEDEIKPLRHNWYVWRKEYGALLKLALPVMGTFACTIALGLSNVLFIGHLGTTELAASALGVMFCTVTGYSIGLGLLTAMDTLGAQAFGAKNYRRVGILLQRTIFILAIAMIPIIALWATSEQILRFAGQSAETAHLAGRYTRVSIIGLPAAFLFESFRRYLECQSIVRPTAVISFIGVGINIIMPAVLIYGLGFGFDAAAPSIVTANWCQAIGLYTWIHVKGLHKQTWPGWSREATREIKPYLALGIPGTIMLCAAWWGFEIHALLAGLKGTVALGAQSLILNTAQLAFMVPLGMGVAASTRVGNALGAGLPNRGALSARAAISAIIVVLTFEAIFFLSIRTVWGYIFSNDDDIVRLVSNTMPIFIVFIFFDGTQGVCSGVLRGAGKQKIGAIANVIGYWIFVLPVAWALAFPANLSVTGQWIAISIASMTIAIVFLTVIYRMDWPLLAHTAHHRELSHQRRDHMHDALVNGNGDGDDNQQHDGDSGGDMMMTPLQPPRQPSPSTG